MSQEPGTKKQSAMKLTAAAVSILSRHLRPYTYTLHVITSGYDQPHTWIQLNVLAQSDIMMWRAFALLLIANPEKLSRPLESFRPKAEKILYQV